MIIHPQIRAASPATVTHRLPRRRVATDCQRQGGGLLQRAETGAGAGRFVRLRAGVAYCPDLRAGADTVGVSFERGPSDKGPGSAGWYNNIWFRKEAEQAGRIAINLIGDAFSIGMRQQAIDTIRQQLGQVDLVIYSLASGIQVLPDGTQVRSVLKTTGQPFSGWGWSWNTTPWCSSLWIRPPRRSATPSA